MPLHFAPESTHSAQVFCILKLLASKLNETWKLISKYYVNKLETQYQTRLDATALESFARLKAYFDQKNKQNIVKFLRNRAGFHYHGFDYGRSLKHVAEGEDKVYLAQHPANSFYYLGEAANWRSLMLLMQDEINLDSAYEIIEDTPVATEVELTLSRDVDEGYRQAFNLVNKHINHVNWQMHLFLYGIISTTIEAALGANWAAGEHEVTTITGAPNPFDVTLPTFVNMEAARQEKW